MEEADALCNRIAILVKGRLECVGSVQHLKNKYGGGYTLELKVTRKEENFDFVQRSVMNLFPEATIQESFGDRITFRIPQNRDLDLALVFTTMESRKSITFFSFSKLTFISIYR